MPTITGPELDAWKCDDDWRAAFHEAFYGTCIRYDGPSPVDQVAELLAYDAGENDGQNWICVVRMDDGLFAVVNAGCDYTGWD